MINGRHVVMVGAGDDVVPFGDFLFEGLGLLAIMLQRVVTQGKVHRRRRRGGEADDGGSQLHRIARLIVADLGGDFAHSASRLRVISNDLFRAQEGGAVQEVGAEITGFDRGRKDAKRCEFPSFAAGCSIQARRARNRYGKYAWGPR